MNAPVQIEQAHRLRQAETEWLRQCAARIRAAHAARPRVAAKGEGR